MQKFITTFLFSYLICSLSVYSNPFYLATNGKDTNSGTMDSPFATVTGALEHIQTLRNKGEISGNVELIIQQGEYRLTSSIILSNSMWDGKDTLFIRGQEGNIPIIKGSLNIGRFEKMSDNLWKVAVPESSYYGKQNIQQLFVNGKRAIRARTPDSGTMFKTEKVLETKLDSNNNITGGLSLQKISLNEKQFNTLKPAFPDIPNVIISINHAWDRSKEFIQNISLQDSSAFILTRPMPQWNTLNNSSQFFFENSMSFLDNPGEWYLSDEGVLFYFPRKEDNINTATAEIPILNQLLVINGSDKKLMENVVFENISFQHTRHLMPPSGEGPNQAAASYSASIELNYAKNITFNNCEISNVSNYGIWFKEGCNYSKMTKCHIHELGMGGVKIGDTRRPKNELSVTNNITIDNNIIQSGGYEVPTGVGVIVFHASDNTISHNDIANFRYTGISVGWVWGYTPSVAKRNKIVYNHIHHLGWGELSDMGGVYTLGLSEGTVVNNNVIHDIYSYGYGGWGLYTDEGSTGIVMENNLVYNCKSSGFHQHYGKENLIRNNIFAFNIISQLQATRIEEHLSFNFTNNIIYFDSGFLLGKSSGANWHKVKLNSDYNCYWDTRTKNILFEDITFKEWQAQGKDLHSIIADPGFVNSKEFDFNFKTKRIANKIGFKPFDYTQAGVYGSAVWKEKAMLKKEVTDAFDDVVKKGKENL